MVNPEQSADGSEAVVHEDVADSQASLSALLSKVDELTEEVNVQRERYLRAVADLENFRKRALREKDEVRRAANIDLLQDLLPVLDNFSLGLAAARQHEGGGAFAEGFQMILLQLSSVLKDHGVEEIAPHGQAFDPNFHESVGLVPHPEIDDGKVAEVKRVGYKVRDRLLRPAVVLLSSGAGPQDARGAEE